MIRVLAVDDEEEVVELIKLQLESRGGFVVQTETNASNALQAAREFGPDVILLDIMMPQVDGSEVAAQFKEDREFKSTPVFFLTALVTQQETMFGQAGGTRTYFPKPIDWDGLVKSIQGVARPASNGVVAKV